MILRRTVILATLAGLILAGAGRARASAATNSPDFKEVYQLLLRHLPGASEGSLNQAAVAGLLSQLGGQASLVSDDETPRTNDAPLQAAMLDPGVAYLRVGQVSGALAAQLSAASQRLSATNQPAGTIVDLRFAAGDAYAAVKAAVAVLTPAKTPLLILINPATRGAAELLAAELREAGALLIGGTTAGQAMTTEEFPLANGDRLRVATTPVQLHGAALLPLQPDIAVPVSLEDERAFMKNPYGPAGPVATAAGEGTNGFGELLDHTSEADLVRQKRKDGDGSENPEPPAKMEDARPVLRDPALARAVDLVTGLAVVRAGRP